MTKNINQARIIDSLAKELTKAHQRIELLEDKLSSQVDELNRLTKVVAVLQDAYGDDR